MIDRRKFLQSLAAASAGASCSPSGEQSAPDPYAADLEQVAVYTAGLDAYYGDRNAWALHMQQVMRADPDNPYYAWFGGRHRTPGPAPSRNAP